MSESSNVTLINRGLCVVHFASVSAQPGQEFQIEAADLELPGFESLISSGVLEVKDNAEKNEEIKEKARSRKKKDHTEGKSIKELEDGGEY